MRFDVLTTKERTAHLAFFGTEFDLSEFESTLLKYGEKKIQAWSDLLLEPHFLPRVEMDRKAEFPGWLVRPDNHSYNVVYQGKVLRQIDGKLQPDKNAHWLSGNTVLIDTRLKPNYESGRQMYENDYLGPFLAELREAGKISRYDYGDQSSRFGVSADEWEEQVKPVLSKDKRFEFGQDQWRFERAIEANVIPQIYLHMSRKNNGYTSTWSWYEEYFGGRSDRVIGGHSVCGGLSVFYWIWSGNHWGYQAFCPLAVL